MESTVISNPDSAGSDLFDRIVQASSGLVVLEGADSSALMARFRTLARRTGQAVYVWQPALGMSNLRDLHASVPGCERLGSALRYMQQSMHFGIYLVVGLELPISAGHKHLLEQLAVEPEDHVRRIVLLDDSTALAAALAGTAVVIDASATSAPRMRLRDGRWLVGHA